MSEENVELARRAVEFYNAHDVAALQGIVTEDVEFRTFLEGRTEAEPLHGHQGIEEWQRSESEAWQSLKFEPDEFRDLGPNRLLDGRKAPRTREGERGHAPSHPERPPTLKSRRDQSS